MPFPSVTCPKCGTPIEITTAITQQIEAGLEQEHQQRLERERTLHEQKLKTLAIKFDDDLAKKTNEISAQEAKKAQERVEARFKLLEQEKLARETEISQARNKEIQWLKAKQDLEKRAADAEVNAARKYDAEARKMVDDAVKGATEQLELRAKQKEIEAEGLRKQVQEMDRKLAQGSQQSQGEAQERSIEDILAEAFPDDELVPKKTGARGADIVERVMTRQGIRCGTILWESKAAKNWSEGWVDKLKEDQREEQADLAVLICQSPPDGITSFGWYGGVWVGVLGTTAPLAAVLRQSVMKLHQAIGSQQGKSEKKELLYSYVQSPAFLHEVRAAAEALADLKAGIDAEKRAYQKQWKTREAQIERALFGVANMYGSLKGFLGNALPAVEVLELPAGPGGPSDPGTSKKSDR